PARTPGPPSVSPCSRWMRRSSSICWWSSTARSPTERIADEEDAPQRDHDGPSVELIVVRAENPGPMTLTCTNSYVVRAGDQVWVADRGPGDRGRLAGLLLRFGSGCRPRGVQVRHRHLDHTAGAATLARQLAARSGLEVPLYAADRSAVPGSRALPSTLESDHGTVGHVVHLPGHTSDSVALLLEGGRL